MLEREENVVVVPYSYGNWSVYVKIDFAESVYSALLQHNRYGIASEMFGLPFSQDSTGSISLLEFIEIVEGNLPNYIDFYKEEYFDDPEEEE